MRTVLVLLVLVVIAAGVFYRQETTKQEVGGDLVLFGNVDIRQIVLAFDANGRVTELAVDEGDTVRAGQSLGQLDMRTLELQAKQAEAEVEVQRQTVLRLKNGTRPEEIDMAQSQVVSAKAEVERALKEYRRVATLQETSTGTVTVQEVESARRDLIAAEAREDESESALRLAEIGPRIEEMAGAKAQLNAAEARVALLRHQIAQGKLLAPQDAVVRSRLLEPGDMASPQRPAFTLALTEPKWVRVYLSEPDLGRVQPGAPVRVTTDSHPDDPLSGSVGYISSVAEFTPKTVQTEELRTSLVYEARIVVKDGANVLRLGQPVTVTVSSEATQ
ncbi:MAG: hypothetical protein CMJ58_01540 [Planctomycetaceae bacterium]|nr:hypothetical protein [Planctomycetaceae bacterium]